MSEIRKIQPIDAEPVKAVSAKTLEKHELVCRRWPLALDALGRHGGAGAIGGNVFVRCDMEQVEQEGMDGKLEKVWQPVIARLVPAWASRGDLRSRKDALAADGMIVRINTNDLPAKMPRGCEVWDVGFGKLSDAKFLKKLESVLLSKGEHAAQNLLKATSVELGDYEELVPRIADKASGNASILYTKVLSLYDFNVDYYPLGSDTDNWWTERDYRKAANGRCERTFESQGFPHYVRKSTPPSPDYGVYIDSIDEAFGTAFVIGLKIREQYPSPVKRYEWIRLGSDNIDAVIAWIASGNHPRLSSRTPATTGWTSMRVEIAGSGPTGIAIYPYKNEVVVGELVVTGQGHHSDAGYGGFVMRNNTATSFDNFQIMVAGGARGLDAGAFGLGRGGRGLSPNAGGLQ
jgi:hypothetical protein